MSSMMMAARKISLGLVAQAATKRWGSIRGDLTEPTTLSRSFLPCVQAKPTCSLSSDRPSRHAPVSSDATKTIKKLSSAQNPRRRQVDVGEYELSERQVAEETRRSTRQQSAALRGFFEAEAASGRVECSSRGCRPIYEENSCHAAPLEKQFRWRTSAPNARTSTTTPPVEFTTIPSHLISDFVATTDLKAAFEAALQVAPGNVQLLSEFAGFTWEAMQDSDAAEKLFTRALDVSPDDPDLLASHALFLWQTDQ